MILAVGPLTAAPPMMRRHRDHRNRKFRQSPAHGRDRQDRPNREPGVGGRDDNEVRGFQRRQRRRRQLGLAAVPMSNGLDGRPPAVFHEIFLESKFAIFQAVHNGGHISIAHGQQGRADAEPPAQASADLGQRPSLPQQMRAQEMGGEVLVTQAKPGRQAIEIFPGSPARP